MTPEDIARIDARLSFWRQGDVVLTDDWVAIHLADLAAPGTPDSEALAASRSGEGELGLDVVAIDAPGFMVVSQTCDIVRSCAERPLVEVCPLQPIPESKAPLIRAGRMSRYLWSPALGDALLAADLDHVTTMEKAALVRFDSDRTAAIATHAEARALAEALGRKRSRAALPDDFVAVLERLQRRVLERHNKQTNEGAFLRGMREIRVRPAPSWDADSVEVEVLFLFSSSADLPSDADEQAEALIKLVRAAGRFAMIEGRIATLDSLTAATYLASDRLDLEHLSVGRP